MCTSKYEHTERLLIFLHEGFLRYHNHKENMAWAGTAAFVVAFGAGLVTKDWPPLWFINNLMWQRLATAMAVTAIAFLAGLFVRWQLKNRRWASCRVDAIESLLFNWLGKPPTEEDLKPYMAPSSSPNRLCSMQKILHWTQKIFQFVFGMVWPSKKLYTKETSGTGAPLSAYPKTLVDAWIMYEQEGRGAPIQHERIITITMWVFFLGLLARTILN